MERLLWFKNHIPENGACLTHSEMNQLVQQYLNRHKDDSEKAQLHKNFSKIQSVSQTIVLDAEKEEYNTGFGTLPL